MSRFDLCLAFVLAREGGDSDDPADSGGLTHRGITQATYSAWLATHLFGEVSVLEATDDEIATIYRDLYWSVCRCDKLPAPLDLVVFDSAVQHSPARAIKLLQSALSVPIDGVIGRQTLAAAISAGTDRTTLAETCDEVIQQRRDYYQRIVNAKPSQGKFMAGWLNRLRLLDEAVNRFFLE